MTKKKAIYSVSADLSDLSALFKGGKTPKSTPKQPPNTADPEDELTIEYALHIVIRQMRLSGLRPRTISDYKTHVNHFAKTTGLTYLSEITADHIYEWLDSMDVSNRTKLIRLKCLKAFLSRCFENGWIKQMFWRPITVRVDNEVKEGATERDLRMLLSVLDLSDFVQLRDATAALLMFKTGIRLGTIVRLESSHVDLEENLLRIPGTIVKNRDQLLLPFDDVLNRMLSALMQQNDEIRKAYGESNDYVFITRRGRIIATGPSNNNIQKRLNKYSKMYGLKNINPHALRRGFAKNLLEKGANITEISKALGHSNLAVTTQYLHLDKEEVAENLRRFL